MLLYDKTVMAISELHPFIINLGKALQRVVSGAAMFGPIQGPGKATS